MCDSIAFVKNYLASIQVKLRFAQVKVIVEREKMNIFSVTIAVFHKHTTDLCKKKMWGKNRYEDVEQVKLF